MTDTKFKKTSKERISRYFRYILDLWSIRTIKIPYDEKDRSDNGDGYCLRRHCHEMINADEKNEDGSEEKVNGYVDERKVMIEEGIDDI